jgi:LuxR family transcriptional regulator, maltose regulon positive regulatory protein
LQYTYLSRKVARPTLPSTILHRTNLVAMLQNAIAPQASSTLNPYKLVLLCAPAGYGKTTLLADFASSVTQPCCWYFLERTDNDYVVFLRTLLVSICHFFPQCGVLETVFTSLFTRDVPLPASAYQPAIDAFCNTLAQEIPGRVALFLCNYEEINDSEILTDLVNYLLKKLPATVTLVIESRAIPNIEFATLLIRDEMFGLSSDALRFSVPEISELARLHGPTPLTNDEAEQLVASFDGWIAGILLGTYLGDFRVLPSSQDLAHRSGNPFLKANATVTQKRKNLFAYIANEVFQRDTEIYNFLQATSILQQMEVDICDALLETDGAAELLPRLEQQGLFVTSYETDSQTIYTCHPIIRDLLKTQLRQKNPERLIMLHQRAAKLRQDRQDYTQAIYHALEAHADELAAQLILDTYKQLLQQGHLDTLTLWLQALAPAVLEKYPRLLLIEATICLTRGQSAIALSHLDKVAALISISPPEESDLSETCLLQAEMNILRGKALFQAGDYPQAQAICQQALDDLPEYETELRSAAKMRVGICANLQGNFTSGIVHLQEAIHYWENQPPTNQVVDIHGALANTYYLIGNFALAEHHLTRALNYCEQLHDEQSKIDNLIRKGIMFTNQGRYDEAEPTLLEALALARKSPSARRGEAYALSNLGSLYLEKGMYKQALAFCEDSLLLARRWGNRSLLHMTLSNLSVTHLLMGDPASALLFVEKIDIQPASEKTVSYERAWHQLTCGMIFLYQERYPEAHACLMRTEADLRNTSLKREMMQALLRLAACELARKETFEALRLLEEVTLLLDSGQTYRQLVLVELNWLPILLLAVKRLPQLAHLRHILALEEDVQEESEKISASLSLLPITAVPKLIILAFGEPVVLLDNQPIKRWRMARAMELFFYLLTSDRPLGKEQIITDLWPDFDEQTNQTFHSTIHYLRKLFGASCIVFQADGYILNLAAHYGEEISYDVQQFQVCRAKAEQALAQRDDLTAREAFLCIVELYRGDYGRSFYSDWCTRLRDELRAAYLDARRQLARIAWHSEAFTECVEHWRHMLSIDNCLEEAHLGLMQCYVRQGKRSTALRQYNYCKETLQEELGIQPGSPIQKLYQRLTSTLDTSLNEGQT